MSVRDQMWRNSCPTCRGAGILNPPNTLAERLAFLRRKSGFTLREVEAQAQALGINLSNAAISQMETGETKRPGFQFVAVLAKIYGITLDDLAEGLQP